MDALELLAAQHQDIEDLLDEVSRARRARERRHRFDAAADRILIHMALEELFLYPTAPDACGDLTAAHLGLRMIVADLLHADDSSLTYEIKLQVLREQMAEHLMDERRLFGQLRRLLPQRKLRQLGREMIAMQARLIVQGGARSQLGPRSRHSQPVLS